MTQQQRLEDRQLDGEGEGLAPEHGDGVDAGGAQGVEGAVLALDGERALDEQQQAEQRGQPHQARGDRLEQRVAGLPATAGRRSRAKANITITTAANGSTWLRPTRLRHSTRRSLPATSHAVRTVAHGRLDHLAGDDVDAAGGQRAGPLQLVAGDDDGRAGGRGLAQRGVELVAPGGVEPGVGLVEQPQLGPAGHEAGQRGAPLLAGREAADRERGEPARQAEAFHRRVDLGPRRADRGAPEAHVLGDGEVEVQAVAVAEQADAAAHRVALGRQVAAEHGPGAAGERHEPGAHPQQRRLAGAVGTAEQHDLAGGDGQRHAGQRREAAEHGDGAGELDASRSTLPLP